MDESEKSRAEFLPLFLACQSDLKAYITTLVRDRSAVDDILQETALVLWNKFAEYDKERPFGAWARTFARFQTMAYLKKQKRSKLVLGESAMLAIDNAMSDLEQEVPVSLAQEALNHCLQKLTERARKLLNLRYHEQFSLDKICQQVEMSMAAVKKNMLRSRIALKECCSLYLREQQ